MVLRFVCDDLAHRNKISFKDYKTKLQEVIQKNPEERLEYVLSGESGPDHAKQFEIEIMLNSNVIARGTGKSKKAAVEAVRSGMITTACPATLLNVHPNVIFAFVE